MSSVAIYDVFTLSEAADLWNIDPSTVRHAIKNKRFFDNEVRQSKGTWLIMQEAMQRVFGEICETTDIYTIGYEGKNIDDFISLLKKNNIHTLFDVREYPLSRKKGFSKNSLAEYLADNNIGYQLFSILGSPKEIRDRLHATWDYNEFFTAYENWLNCQTTTFEIIKTAVSENCDKRFCLMCFEKKPNECHRSVIASKLVERDRAIQRVINI